MDSMYYIVGAVTILLALVIAKFILAHRPTNKRKSKDFSEVVKTEEKRRLNVVETFRQRRHSCYQDLLSNKLEVVHIISVTDLETHLPRMVQLAQEYQIMGLDGEWTSEGKYRGPVALLQIGFPNGTCYLLAMKAMFQQAVCEATDQDLVNSIQSWSPEKMLLEEECLGSSRRLTDVIPTAFCQLLADKSCLKFGVGIQADVQYLLSDYGLIVRGFVDIRHLFNRLAVAKTHSLGLKSFSQHWLGLEYSGEELMAQRSDWETTALNLNAAQKRYAAMDALVGALCPLEFLCRRREQIWIRKARSSVNTPGNNEFVDEEELQQLTLLPSSPENLKDLRENLRSYCQGCVDQKVPNKNLSSAQSDDAWTPTAPSKPNNKLHRHPLRKKPLYSNGILLAPNDEMLCTVDHRKAHWYLSKGLAEPVSYEPTLTVRLKFNPSGRPQDQSDGFYLQEKANLCVVCGESGMYVRKHVVPQEYRRFFPKAWKSHKSHDVVLLCPSCHQQSIVFDDQLKARLGRRFSVLASRIPEQDAQEMQELKQVISAAKALLFSGPRIPVDRREELEARVRAYLSVDELTEDALREILSSCEATAHHKKEVLRVSAGCHGREVVDACVAQGSLMQFEKMWRQHFLDMMQPKFLPAGWSVDHRHERLKDFDFSKTKQKADLTSAESNTHCNADDN